jgi:hypothetical protein
MGNAKYNYVVKIMKQRIYQLIDNGEYNEALKKLKRLRAYTRNRDK